jgi:hypothetical protein
MTDIGNLAISGLETAKFNLLKLTLKALAHDRQLRVAEGNNVANMYTLIEEVCKTA